MDNVELKEIEEGIIDQNLPPQNIEAEQSVLGSLMIDKDGITKIVDIIKAEDFYKRSHQLIYSAILDLYKKNEPIDLLSLTNRLEEKGELEEVNGTSYLTSLVECVPTTTHIVNYARIVQRKKALRDLIDAAQYISELGYKETEDIEDILDQAEKKIFSISQRSLKQEFIQVREALEEAFERIDKLHKGDGSLRGVPTGFPELDSYLAGLQKSDLVILAARPSLGKTTLAMDIVRNVAVKENLPVGIFSLEMSKEQVVDRLISAEAQISLWHLRTGKLSHEGDDNDFFRIQDAMGILSEAPIYIDDAASSNVMQIRAMARRLKAEHGLSLIVIDYLQLMTGRDKFESRVQEISEISRSLKNLARELDTPILALSQLSRAVEQRSPQIPKLSDLRESGSIEQDADVVLFIYREDKDKRDTERQNIAEIHIAKHRNGPTGKVELYFHEDFVSFRSVEHRFTEET